MKNYSLPFALRLRCSTLALAGLLGLSLAQPAAAAPARVQQATGNALAFDGSNDYVALPNNLNTGVTNFTFEAWLNYQDNGNWTRVMDFGAGTNVNMFLTPKSDTNTPRFAITTSGGTNEQRITAPAVLSAGWHHLAVTLSKSGSVVTGRLYVDGAAVATNAAMSLSPTDLGALTQTWLGRSQYNDPYLKGQLDEVRIYNAALTQAQVQTDMNGTTSALPGNQLAYYDFDQGTASGNNTSITTVLDRSGNARNGTLTNFARTGSASNFVAAPNQLPVSTIPTGFLSAASMGGLQPTDVKYDANGDIFVLGIFTGSLTLGSLPALNSAGNNDVVVAKRSGSTGAWLWASQAGGAADDFSRELAVDGSGNVGVSGFFSSATASFGAAASQSSTGGFDGFVAKLNGSTGAFVWSTKVGSSGTDVTEGLAVDGSGDFIAVGSFNGSLTLGSTTLSNDGGTNAYVAKLNGSTGSYTWATRASGGASGAGAVAVNSVGDLAVTGGNTGAATFGAAGALTYSGGTYDSYVSKLTAAGAWVWVKKIAGANQDIGEGIAFNAADDILTTGHFGAGAASADGVALTGPSTSTINRDVYVVKMDGTSGTVRWALVGGGTRDDRGASLAVDAAGNAVVGGVFASTATFGSFSLVSAASVTIYNGFTARVKDNGTSGTWDWAFKTTSSADTRTSAVAVNKATGDVVGVTVSAGTATYQGVAATVAAGGSLGIVAAPYTAGSLTLSGAGQTVPQGLYSSLTIASPGAATLAGPIVVNGSLTVAGTLAQSAANTLAGTGSFTLAAGGTLDMGDLAGLSASGVTCAVRTTGARSLSNDASYTYSGTAAQVTGAGLPATVRGLTVNNAAGLTLSQAVGVTQLARLQSGNLTTGGNTFTLRSVRGQGAAVLDNTGGVVSGTATVQRAVDVSFSSTIGYHHYSAPVSNTTLADLTVPGVFAPVFSASYNTAVSATQVRPFPTVFGYDERRLTPGNGLSGPAASSLATDLGTFEKGYFSPVATDAWPVGRGYTANVPNAAVVDFVGTLNNAAVNITGLTRGPSVGSPDQAGWQLLGNPYPAPLDWSTVTTAQLTNMDAAMYVFQATDTYAGTYRTYLSSGSGVPNSGIGAQPLIGSGAGFFARVTAPGTGALNLTNTNRVTTYGTQPAFGRQANSARALLTLQVAGTNVADELHIYTDANATPGVDARYDAVKMTNPNGLNLAALAGNTPLAIDGLPAITTTTLVPLTLAAPAAGTYAFTITALANFGQTRVYLRDVVAGTETLLAAGSAVPVTLNSVATASTRFSLVFRPAGALATASNTLAAQASVYPNPASGSFTLLLPPMAGTSTATATLLNALGQVVNTRSLTLTAGGANTEYVTNGLAAGIYTLRLQAGNQAAALRVVVK